MDTGTRWAIVEVIAWFVVVLALVILDAPVNFRGPGGTLRTGLGISRLVTLALNACEYLFAVIIAVALFTHETSVSFNVACLLAIGSLIHQTILIRPLLSRRTAVVIVEEGDGPRSRAQYAYVGLEFAKLAGLIWAGVLLLGGGGAAF